MTLQQILYFIEVAHTRHFTQAAQNLFVSQSALSYSVQSLEKELGVPLFIRRKSGKNVELTDYGETFLPYCEQVVATLDAGKTKLDELRNPSSGVVSVVYSYMNCHRFIPELFNDFYEENDYSDISVQFNVNYGRAKIEEKVLSGDIDLGFACTEQYDGLETIVVDNQELVVMLPVSHPLANKKKLTLEDLREERMISYDPESNLYRWITEMYRTSGLKMNIQEAHDDWYSFITHVALNRGVTIAPQLPVDPGLIATVPLDHPMRYRKVYMFWAKERELSPAAEYVRKYIIDYTADKR